MSLILHCGASPATREEVDAIATPEGTDTWTPVPHGELIDTVADSLSGSGLRAVSQDYATTRDGNRLFGLFTLGSDNPGGDYALTIGLRNSHDKSFPISVCCGIVCSCATTSPSTARWSSRRNTRGTSRIACHGSWWRLFRSSRRVGGLRSDGSLCTKRRRFEVSPICMTSHCVYRAQAIPASAVTRVIEEYETPKHDEFKGGSLWCFQNAVTEVLKSYGDIQRRTLRLAGVLDTEVGESLLAV